MNNNQKYREYQKKKIIKLTFILLAFGVIILEVLALLGKINMLWGLGLFIVMQLLNKIILK